MQDFHSLFEQLRAKTKENEDQFAFCVAEMSPDVTPVFTLGDLAKYPGIFRSENKWRDMFVQQGEEELWEKLSTALRNHSGLINKVTFLTEQLDAAKEYIRQLETGPITISKVMMVSDGYYGSISVEIVEGIGKIPETLRVKTPDGEILNLSKTVMMVGGGHGEGAAYPTPTWACKEHSWIPSEYMKVTLDVI